MCSWSSCRCFLSTGLRTNWNVGGVMVLAAAAVLLLASVSGKLVGIHLAGKILKWGKGASLHHWMAVADQGR